MNIIRKITYRYTTNDFCVILKDIPLVCSFLSQSKKANKPRIKLGLLAFQVFMENSVSRSIILILRAVFPLVVSLKNIVIMRPYGDFITNGIFSFYLTYHS